MVSGFSLAPLGGGDEIGASSLFISWGTGACLIDAGLRMGGDIRFPAFHRIKDLGNPSIQSLADLDGIIVTHAHLDHIGSIPYVVAQVPKMKIYMTEPTLKFGIINWKSGVYRIQALQSGTTTEEHERILEDRSRLVDETMKSIICVNYYKKIQLGPDCTATLIPAGHLMGAASIYLETEKQKLLPL